MHLAVKCLVFSRKARRPSTKELSSGSQGQGGNTVRLVPLPTSYPCSYWQRRFGDGVSMWRYQRLRDFFLCFPTAVFEWDLRWWRWSIAPWSWQSARSWPPDAANWSKIIDFDWELDIRVFTRSNLTIFCRLWIISVNYF